ncbi:MAG: hypothetical protein QNJ85_02905 [Gammaproteobacteria bacterium]|nr:hypothetical protein [Gammaproteobacteria bacterium]
MSEHILYLGTAILIAVSILTTKFAFSDSHPDELRTQAAMVQQQYMSREHSTSACALNCLAGNRDTH